VPTYRVRQCHTPEQFKLQEHGRNNAKFPIKHLVPSPLKVTRGLPWFSKCTFWPRTIQSCDPRFMFQRQFYSHRKCHNSEICLSKDEWQMSMRHVAKLVQKGSIIRWLFRIAFKDLVLSLFLSLPYSDICLPTLSMCEGLLVRLITINDKHSESLPWTMDQPVAETTTRQHTTITRESHPCPRSDSKPQSQQASGRRPTP
jgi:hypothetical protein